MIKKPDLKIDTQFFDDNLNGIHIPEAIRVTQSIDTQTFIKEGLNDEAFDGATLLATQAIEKIISQRLFDNFLTCWTKLKANIIPRFVSQGTPPSQKRHKRESPLIQNVSDEYETASNTQFRGIERQRPQFSNIRSNLLGETNHWIEQKRRQVKSKTTIRGWSQGKAKTAENHYERAKVLKQIVDKLKYGRQVATSFIDQLETSRENQHLHHKLDKLERMMEDVHYNTTLRGTTNASQKLSVSNSQPPQQRQNQDIETEMMIRLRQELLEVKNEMDKIRKTNQQLLRQQDWKKSQMLKISSSRSQIQTQFDSLRNQISYLERQKHANELNNLRFQHELSIQNANRQQFQRQIYFLTQRISQAELKEREQKVKISQQSEKTMVPMQVNSFGYSLIKSQKNSNAAGKNEQQNTQPVGSVPVHLQINQQALERADDWACC